MQTKEVQGKLWSSAPSDWVKYIEPRFIPMYRSVLTRLHLNEQKMILDVGCGSGLFLSMVLPTGAAIHGIDAAPGLLEISKKRLPGVTLMMEDMEDIPFCDETFDYVTSFDSFQFAGSFQNALAEARRVTKKFGKVVIGIWGKEEDCDAGVVLKAVGALLPPPPQGTPGPFALSQHGKVEAICESVGLKVLEKQRVACPWHFAGVEELQTGFMCTGPCVKAAQIVGGEKVRAAIRKSAEPFILADGLYRMRNQFIFFITEKI
jgi:SAM-dependent methyltransferase